MMLTLARADIGGAIVSADVGTSRNHLVRHGRQDYSADWRALRPSLAKCLEPTDGDGQARGSLKGRRADPRFMRASLPSVTKSENEKGPRPPETLLTCGSIVAGTGFEPVTSGL